MKKDDVIRFMDIDELEPCLPCRVLLPCLANHNPMQAAFYEPAQRVRTILLSLFAMLLKVSP